MLKILGTVQLTADRSMLSAIFLIFTTHTQIKVST